MSHTATLLLMAAKETELVCELRSSNRRGNFTPDVLLEEKVMPVAPAAGASTASKAVKKIELYTRTNGSVSLEEDPAPDTTESGAPDNALMREVEMTFDSRVKEDQYLFLCLRKNPDIQIRCSQRHLTGMMSLASKGNFRVSNGNIQKLDRDIGVDTLEFWIPERWPDSHLFAMKFNPPLEAFSVDNLTNGFARPFFGTNAWVADFEDRSPVLTISWDSPQTIRRIELAFDTDVDHPMESVLMGHPCNVVPFCIRKYRIYDAVGRLIHECTENHQTRNVITFDIPVTTNLLKIELQSPDRNIPAALFEVRCYE